MPSQHDLQRSKHSAWEYLMRPRLPGPVSVGTRGKGLAIAAGYVSGDQNTP